MAVTSTADAPMAGQGAGLPRAVLFVIGAIVALIATAVVLALAVPERPASFPAGTPEAAFQAYYRAWLDGDLDTSYTALSSNIRRDVTPSAYRRMDADWSWQRDQDRRVVVLGADATGDRATVHLRIESVAPGGLLGPSRWSEERSVRLVREGGRWLIDQPLVGVEIGFGY